MNGFELSTLDRGTDLVSSERSTRDEDDGLRELLIEFLDEAEASLLGIEPAVVQLERCPDDLAALGEAFRVMHTFKGTGGFLGLTRLSALAHATEEVLDRLRRDATAGLAAGVAAGPDAAGPDAAGPDAVGPILIALDRLADLLRQTRAGGREPAGEDDDVLAALHGSARPGSAAPVLAKPVSAKPASAIRGPTARSDHQAEVGAIRVAVPVLERLLASVGELVLARNQLVYQAERMAAASQDGDATLGLLAQHIGSITTELQAAVLRTRMQPIGQAWATLPRLVRDLSVRLGKRIVLETTGTAVELDRQVLELLRDPLSHMVRNSCDHGIETPEARVAAGKPATGRITLAARPNGASVVVTLRDDGQGIDTDRLRARARADGVLTETEAAAMSEAQAAMLAFRAGVSTAAEVTAVSGRGVGMDVVKTNIERIGGSVALASTRGHGTTLTLTLPLTLAIMPALMVTAHGQRFALPRAAVGEIVSAPLSRDAVGVERAAVGRESAVITTRAGAPMLSLHDELIPLLELGVALGIAPATVGGAPTYEEPRHVVIVRSGAIAYGLVVDPVFETEEIVVTPLCAVLRGVAAFGGTTILGDGCFALVLDVSGLARMAGIDAAPARPASLPRAPQDDDAADAIPLLLFSAAGQPMAVPLTLIARLEEVDGAAIVTPADGPPAPITVRANERLLPACDLRSRPPHVGGTVAALIVGDPSRDGARHAALLVDQVEDVVMGTLRLEDGGRRPGVLGTTLLSGVSRAVLDVLHWLTRIDPAWANPPPPSPPIPRLLVVDDSEFFRHLLIPSLTDAGYAVTGVASAAEALGLRDGGARFDAVVTELDLPGMGGAALAAAIGSGGPWVGTPVIALTAPTEADEGQCPELSARVSKFERAALLAALERRLLRVAAA